MKKQEIRRFRRALRRFDRLQARQLKDCCSGVTPAQCHVLMELDEAGPVTSGVLARLLDIDASTLTRTADRLVAAGLIARDTHPEDRRALVISMTDAGRELCERLHRDNDAAARRVFAVIPQERRQELLAAFEALVAAMREAAPDSAGVLPTCGDGGCNP